MIAPPERIGRDGFTGSSITSWCEPCRDWVLVKDDGSCVWCDDKPPSAPELPTPGEST